MDDPFAVLGLPRRFRLEPAELQRAYLARSAAAHPDVQKDSGENAAALNRAKGILQDPELRAGALLAILGGPGKEQDRSLPEGFLAEMMEIREKMEEGGEGEMERWEEWGEERREAHIRRVGELFARVEAGEKQAEILRQIRMELNAWRYIERLIEQLGEPM